MTRHNAEIIIKMAVAVISVKLEEVTSLVYFANLDEPLYALILLDRYAQRGTKSEPSLQRALDSPTSARANA